MNPNSITPGISDDVAEMERMERAAFATPWSGELLHAAILSREYSVRVLRSTDIPVVGFSIFRTQGRVSNLDNLVVAEPCQGRGNGKVLLEDWFHRATSSEASTLTLQVNINNQGAQKFYRAFRFKATRLLNGYYPNGEDAFQMEKQMLPDEFDFNFRTLPVYSS